MQNTITINVENRKYKMQVNRRQIDVEIWEKYIENNYPEWHKEKYSNNWPIRIIYYDKNHYGIFKLYLSRWTNMYTIIQKLNKIIEGQLKMIDKCFGEDVSENIKKFLYKNFYIEDNFMYMHRNIYDFNHNTNNYLLEDLPCLDKGRYYIKERWALNGNCTINNISSLINADAIISRFMTFRLRNNNPIRFNSFQVKTVN